MPKNSRIGERIKKVRLDQRMTQTEFGSEIGVKGNTVTGYESGVRIPSDSVINNICKTFNVNETWLRSGDLDLDMYIPVQSKEGPLFELFAKKNCTLLERRILSEFYNLTEDERVAFIKLIVKMFPDATRLIAGGDPLEPFWQKAPSIEVSETENPSSSDNADASLGSDQSVAAAEALYEKNLGIAPNTDSSVSNTTDATGSGGQSGGRTA